MAKTLTPRDQLKRRIVLRARKVVRECDQAIRDFEYWNGLQAERGRKPIAIDDFREMRAAAQGVIDQFARMK